MSIVPMTPPVGASTGTIISERVEPNAVRYCGSADTSSTSTLRPVATAVPVRPSVCPNRGNLGGPGPAYPMIATATSVTSYTPTQR